MNLFKSLTHLRDGFLYDLYRTDRIKINFFDADDKKIRPSFNLIIELIFYKLSIIAIIKS